jgi:hypothetical protein
MLYDFNNNSEHWGDIREIEEEGLSEEIEEDVSIDGEERPGVENIFNNTEMNINNITNLKQNLKENNLMLNSAMPVIPNPNANIVYSNIASNEKNFYTVLEQKNVNVKTNELFGSNYGYVIPEKKEEESVKNGEEKINQVEVNANITTAAVTNTKKEKEKIKFKF